MRVLDEQGRQKVIGYTGHSGFSGYSGLSGTSGYSGVSGFSGTYSGFSGHSGESGFSGISGQSGTSGESGFSGISGTSGWSGLSGTSGYSGTSGWSGASGYSGTSGTSGTSGYSGTSGESGFSGISGTSGWSGISGTSGYSGSSGWSGVSGYSGSSGTSGTSGYSGTSGESGFSGISGVSGWSGQSGTSGYSGSSGWSGISGYSGSSGISGTSGYSGVSGQSGESGTSGYSGYSGTSGYSGGSGFSGTSGFSGFSGFSGQIPVQDLGLLYDIAGTGLLKGGVISINGGDNTKFDIADGAGYVVDNFTDALNPVATFVQWSGFSATTDLYLATNNQTNIGIDKNGAIVQQGGDPFTTSQSRDVIILGKTVHPNLSSISTVVTVPRPLYGVALRASDLSEALGIVNIYGNEFRPNGANLNINKTIGENFRVGGNYEFDKKSPSTITLNALTVANFRYRWRNGSGGFYTSALISSIDPDSWDNGTGILQGVPTGKFTVQRIYLYTTNNVYITYGQAVYDTLSEARASAFEESPVVDPNFSKDASLRCFITIQEGTSALNDEAKAVFINTGKLGESSIVGPMGDSGASGLSGTSGESGASGESGVSGFSGMSGYSAFSGVSGFSGHQENPARIINLTSTGMLNGGIIGYSYDTTKFSITDGTGIVVDNYTDTLNPTRTIVSWSGFSGVTATYLPTDDLTYVFVDASANIIQQTTPPTYDQFRDLIFIGAVTHAGHAAIETVAPSPVASYDGLTQLWDFLYAFGSFNISGDVYTSNGANLYVSKSGGQSFVLGGNYATDKKVPNVHTTSPQVYDFFVYAWQVTPGSWTLQTPGPPPWSIDPNNYDDGYNLGAVPSGKFTIQTFFFDPRSEATIVQYGQVVYDTMGEAEANLQKSILISPFVTNLVFRSWLIVKEGATDLTDGTKAKFVAAGKFGLNFGGSTGEVATASNIGFSGTGIFSSKVGVDFQFKSLRAASPLVTVTNNPGMGTVDIDVTPGTSGFSGFSAFSGLSGTSGTSAFSGTSGYSGISGTSAFSGISGSSGLSGTSGYSGVSGFSSQSGMSGFSGVAAVDTMPTLIARHSLNQNCQTNFTNVHFNTNAMNLASEITHSETVDNDRFYVGTTAEYLIISRLRSDTIDTSARLAMRALVDDLTVLTDSTYDTGTGPAADSNTIHVTFVARLTAGTYITIQALKSSSGESWLATDTMVQFVKLTGVSGYSGFSSDSGYSGYSGPSGHSGYSGFSGTYSGWSGQSGTSGTSGYSGQPGYSGTVGNSGYSGTSGFSGAFSGMSGFSGFSGEQGPIGPSGIGYSGTSGFSGVITGISLEHNTAFVDGTHGSDVNGEVENRRLPFATIQAAIDACVVLGPSASNVFSVLVRPGAYIEDIEMYDYVNVKGSGDDYDTDIQGTVTFGANVFATSEIDDCNITSSNAPCVIFNCAADGAYGSMGTCWMQAFYDDDQAMSCCVQVQRGWAYFYAGCEMDVTKTNSFAGEKRVSVVYVTGGDICRFDSVGSTFYNYSYDEDDEMSILYSDNNNYQAYNTVTGGYSELQPWGAAPANKIIVIHHNASNNNTLFGSHQIGIFMPFTPHSCISMLSLSQDGLFPQSGISIADSVINISGAILGQAFSMGATGVYDATILTFVTVAHFLGDFYLPRYTALGVAGRVKRVVSTDQASLFVTGHIESHGFGNSIVPTTSAVYGFSGNDYSVLADSTSNSVTVVLPTWAYEGQVANIKKISASNEVVVDGVTKTIDGAGYSMALLGQNESVTLQYYSGFSGWYRIGLGVSGTSGFSGESGLSGISGVSGFSAYSGESGWSGISGFSGLGTSGFSGQGAIFDVVSDPFFMALA